MQMTLKLTQDELGKCVREYLERQGYVVEHIDLRVEAARDCVDQPTGGYVVYVQANVAHATVTK